MKLTCYRPGKCAAGVSILVVSVAIVLLYNENRRLSAELRSMREKTSGQLESDRASERSKTLNSEAMMPRFSAKLPTNVPNSNVVASSVVAPTPAIKFEGVIALTEELGVRKSEMEALERDLFSMAKALKITPELLEHPENAPEQYRDFFSALDAWKVRLQSFQTAEQRLKAELVDTGNQVDLPDASAGSP